MTPEQTAWLAGWLEGEGCFMFKEVCSSNASPRIIVQAFSTDKDVVERVARLMGISLYRIKPRDHYAGWTSSEGWRANVEGQKAVDLMTAIRTMMGARRGAQIDKALAAWASRTNLPAE